jgi:hypothetical protein
MSFQRSAPPVRQRQGCPRRRARRDPGGLGRRSVAARAFESRTPVGLSTVIIISAAVGPRFDCTELRAPVLRLPRDLLPDYCRPATRFRGRGGVRRRRSSNSTIFVVSMSTNGSGRRRGRRSRYLNGGISALRRGTCQPSDAVMGTWTADELARMNAKFCAAVESAIKRGLERRSSARANARSGAGDRDRLAAS